MPRIQPTADQLVSASEDLLYEIEMFGHTAQLLYAATPLTASTYWVDKTHYFAMLESFAIHARSLMGFFYPSGRSAEGDLHSTDYVPHWRGPGKWEGFDQDRTRLHVEIMHLNVKRPAETRGWNYGRISEGINRLLRAFLDEVDDELLAIDFKARARSAMPNPFGGWISTPTQTFESTTRLQERQSTHTGEGAVRDSLSSPDRG
jgi:hypothetical protein